MSYIFGVALGGGHWICATFLKMGKALKAHFHSPLVLLDYLPASCNSWCLLLLCFVAFGWSDLCLLQTLGAP